MGNDKLKKAMNHARFISENYSRDNSSKIGALIIGADGEPLSWGYNGFPRGVNDDKQERYERPLKYSWTEHAERNAIYNAARSGHKLLGSSMFIYGLCPCPDCSRGIIQAGISNVFMEESSFDMENPRVQAWAEGWKISREMLIESGTQFIVVNNKGEIHKELSYLV